MTDDRNGKSHPDVCTHPLAAVIPHPVLAGKSLCTLCSTVGEVMTKLPSGLVVPKGSASA